MTDASGIVRTVPRCRGASSALGGEGGAEGGAQVRVRVSGAEDALPPEGGAEEGGAEGELPSDGVEEPAPARKPLELDECESVSVPAEPSVLERRRAGKSALAAAAFSCGLASLGWGVWPEPMSVAPRCSCIMVEPRRPAEEHEESTKTPAVARAASARKRLAETSGPLSSEEAATRCVTREAEVTAAAMSGSSGLHVLGSEGVGGGDDGGESGGGGHVIGDGGGGGGGGDGGGGDGDGGAGGGGRDGGGDAGGGGGGREGGGGDGLGG